MEVGVVEAEPGEGASKEEVGPVVFDLEFAQEKSGGDSGGEEQQPLWREGMIRGGIEDGDDGEGDGVVGDGEEEEEGDAGVGFAEDEAGDEPGDGDVGGGRDAPAFCECGGADEGVEKEEERDGAEDAAEGCEEGVEGFAEGVEVSGGAEGCGDFDGGDSEEEDHEEVVGEEVEGLEIKEGGVDGVLVCIVGDVCPEECGEEAGDEGEGEFAEEVEGGG